MLTLLAGWFPQRQFLVSGDSAYGGRSVLRHLPANVDLISHVHPKGALYAPPPVRQPGQKGARRKKGPRLPSMAAWAADGTQPWQELVSNQFGLHATLWVKSRQALYYKAGKERLLTIVLVHDVLGKRPDQMFYCTRLDWPAQRILSSYAARWAIELIQPLYKPTASAQKRNLQLTQMHLSRLLHRLAPLIDEGLAQTSLQDLLRSPEPLPQARVKTLSALVQNMITLSKELRS